MKHLRRFAAEIGAETYVVSTPGERSYTMWRLAAVNETA